MKVPLHEAGSQEPGNIVAEMRLYQAGLPLLKAQYVTPDGDEPSIKKAFIEVAKMLKGIGRETGFPDDQGYKSVTVAIDIYPAVDEEADD